jgi:hypothetical protein
MARTTFASASPERRSPLPPGLRGGAEVHQGVRLLEEGCYNFAFATVSNRFGRASRTTVYKDQTEEADARATDFLGLRRESLEVADPNIQCSSIRSIRLMQANPPFLMPAAAHERSSAQRRVFKESDPLDEAFFRKPDPLKVDGER